MDSATLYFNEVPFQIVPSLSSAFNPELETLGMTFAWALGERSPITGDQIEMLMHKDFFLDGKQKASGWKGNIHILYSMKELYQYIEQRGKSSQW